MSEQPRLLIARTTSLPFEHPACATYLSHLAVQLSELKWFSRVEWAVITNNRILDARNTAVEFAKNKNCDFLLFIDPDMEPDVEVGRVETALPFFQSSYRFLGDLRSGKISQMPEGSLGIIGAPAISGPPAFKANVMLVTEDNKYRRATHQDCIDRPAQIERVFSVGTGLMLIPMGIFDKLEHPYFDDIYKEDKKTSVWCSQDFSFCMRCNQNGVTVWCNWYAWARHWKMCPLDRPNEHLTEYLKGTVVSSEDTLSCQEAERQTTASQSPSKETCPVPAKSSAEEARTTSSSTDDEMLSFIFQER